MELAVLKQRLGEQFRDTGALDSVKAKLRAQFVQQLNSAAAAGSASNTSGAAAALDGRTGDDAWLAFSSRNKENQGNLDLLDIVAHSVVAEHLACEGLKASLSIFTPECGARKRGGLRDRAEIMALLGVSPSSSVFDRLMPPLQTQQAPNGSSGTTPAGGSGTVPGPGGSLLRTLLTEVSRPNPDLAVVGLAHGRSVEAGTQTDRTGPSPREALDHALRRLDDEHVSARERRSAEGGGGRTVEEHMSKFEREAEARITKHVRDSEARARQHELEKVVLESGAETRAKLAALRHQLQAEHRRAQEALRDQVARAEDAAARRVADAEGKGFEERQKLLSDMDALRRRQAQQDEAMATEKALLAKQRETLRRESEAVAGKRDALDQRERDLDARHEAQRQSALTEARNRFEEQLEALSQQRALCEQEQAAARAAREATLALQEELNMLKGAGVYGGGEGSYGNDYGATMDVGAQGRLDMDEGGRVATDESMGDGKESFNLGGETPHSEHDAMSPMGTATPSAFDKPPPLQTAGFGTQTTPGLAGSVPASIAKKTPNPGSSSTMRTTPKSAGTTHGKPPYSAKSTALGHTGGRASPIGMHGGGMHGPRDIHSALEAKEAARQALADEVSNLKGALSREALAHTEELNSRTRDHRKLEDELRRKCEEAQSDVRRLSEDLENAKNKLRDRELDAELLRDQVESLNSLLQDQAKALHHAAKPSSSGGRRTRFHGGGSGGGSLHASRDFGESFAGSGGGGGGGGGGSGGRDGGLSAATLLAMREKDSGESQALKRELSELKQLMLAQQQALATHSQNMALQAQQVICLLCQNAEDVRTTRSCFCRLIADTHPHHHLHSHGCP